jgi:hypothetical protein
VGKFAEEHDGLSAKMLAVDDAHKKTEVRVLGLQFAQKDIKINCFG